MGSGAGVVRDWLVGTDVVLSLVRWCDSWSWGEVMGEQQPIHD